MLLCWANLTLATREGGWTGRQMADLTRDELIRASQREKEEEFARTVVQPKVLAERKWEEKQRNSEGKLPVFAL